MHPASLRPVDEQITHRHRHMAGETERTVNGEEDNADDNQRDEIVDAGNAEEASAENADVTEAPNNHNAQDTDIMEEVRSLDAHQGTKDSITEQQRTEATSSRSLPSEVKTRIEYKQKGTDDVRQEAVVISRAGKASGTNKM